MKMISYAVVVACVSAMLIFIGLKFLPKPPDPVEVTGAKTHFQFTAPDGVESVKEVMLYPVTPGKKYMVQLCYDGTNYQDGYSFRAISNQQNISWTVSPTGPWPRLLETP